MAKIQVFDVLAGALGVATLFVAGCSPPAKEDMNERIEKSCQAEYGSRGEEAVNECRIRLSIEYLQKSERGKMDSARRGAGL